MERNARPCQLLNRNGRPEILMNCLSILFHFLGRGVLVSSASGGRNAVAILGAGPIGNAREEGMGGGRATPAGEWCPGE